MARDWHGWKINLPRYYAVRWHDSPHYTSVNHVDYVLRLMSLPRPAFYGYLVYELIDTPLTFAQLTGMLPFDQSLCRVSSLRLHALEKAKLRYHLQQLRAANPTRERS